jgi:hypothetical protein
MLLNACGKGPLRGQMTATDGSVGHDRFPTIARRRVALSQDKKIQKRRWLAALISVAKPNAAWLVPAILSPVIAGGMMGRLDAQSPAAPTGVTQTQTGTPAQAGPEFVMSKLDTALEKANANDAKAAASAFAERCTLA